MEIMKSVVGPSSPKTSNLALLLLRVGIGLVFMRLGYGIIAGGPAMWAQLGAMMGNLGIHFWVSFWGLCAGIIEFAGGLSLVLGLFVRKWVVSMAFVMVVAVIYHAKHGDPWTVLSYPLAMLFVFLALLLLGSGRYSLDALIYGKLK